MAWGCVELHDTQLIITIDDMKGYTNTNGNSICQFWANGYGSTNNSLMDGLAERRQPGARIGMMRAPLLCRVLVMT